jgi:hypothetical protein
MSQEITGNDRLIGRDNQRDLHFDLFSISSLGLAVVASSRGTGGRVDMNTGGELYILYVVTRKHKTT